MKTRFLAILITATLALAAVPSTASAEDNLQTASMEAVGSSAAIGLFCAHMGLNTLGDGWQAKTYPKNTALKLAGGYMGGINAVSESLTKLSKQEGLAAGDKASLVLITEACALIVTQAEALITHVNDPSDKNAADYQTARAAAQKKIFEFMGLEEGVIPPVGDAIGK